MPSDMQGRKITKYPATYFSRGHSTCQVTQEYPQARANPSFNKYLMGASILEATVGTHNQGCHFNLFVWKKGRNLHLYIGKLLEETRLLCAA